MLGLLVSSKPYSVATISSAPRHTLNLYRPTGEQCLQWRNILLKLLGDFVPRRTYQGFATGPYWGTSVPRTPPPRTPLEAQHRPWRGLCPL